MNAVCLKSVSLIFLFFSTSTTMGGELRKKAISTISEECISRLDHHTRILARCISTYEASFVKERGTSQRMFECYCSAFNHDLIRWCSKRIEEKKSITVLCDIWGVFRRHYIAEYMEDGIFIYNYAALLFILYQQLRFVLSADDIPFRDLPSLCDVITLYNQVSSLQLDKILDLLDKSYNALQQIQAFIDAFDRESGGSTYWWAIPVVVASFIAAYIRHSTHTSY